MEYICSIHRTGEELMQRRIQMLFEQIELVLVPLINPVGYYRNEPGERLTDEMIQILQAEGINMEEIDVRTDFPYDQEDPRNCLNSISARILFKLMTENSFNAALQLHGGGNLIGYPWGSPSKTRTSRFVNEAYQNPDEVAYEKIAKVMRDQAGSFNYLEDVTFSTVNYRTGAVGTEVFPLPGRFVDWSYAAAWDR